MYNANAQWLDIYTAEDPILSFEQEGSITGLSTDIVEDILRRTDSTDKIKLVPWARAYKSILLRGNTVTYSMERTPDRERLFHWIGPIVQKKWVFYANKNNDFSINSLVDAKSLSIAVIQGDARAVYLKEQGFENLYEVSTNSIALNMLDKGRIDLWATSDFEAPAFIKNGHYELHDFKKVHTFKTNDFYIAMSKHISPFVVNQWVNAFIYIKRDGTMDKTAKKWKDISGLDLTGKSGFIAIKDC